MQTEDEPAEIAMRLHDPRVIDAKGRMVELGDMDEAELGQIIRVMDAMFRWREAEARVSAASRDYMRLGDNDMKALRLMIVLADQGKQVTATDLAQHLGISSAATTKLLDRLERANHIVRERHATDRRAIAVVVSPETRTAAEQSVGREHARRFKVAASLTAEEREAVIRFLDAMGATTEGDWSGA